MDGHIMRCSTIGSCQSAATSFRDCKALLVTSLTHVSGAITSVQTFTFQTSGHPGVETFAFTFQTSVTLCIAINNFVSHLPDFFNTRYSMSTKRLEVCRVPLVFNHITRAEQFHNMKIKCRHFTKYITKTNDTSFGRGATSAFQFTI